MNETPTEPKAICPNCGYPNAHLDSYSGRILCPTCGLTEHKPTPPPEAAGETASDTIKDLLQVADMKHKTGRFVQEEVIRTAAEELSALTSKLAELTKELTNQDAQEIRVHAAETLLAAKTPETEGSRKDKERLDWLESETIYMTRPIFHHTGFAACSLRASIDHALSSTTEAGKL